MTSELTVDFLGETAHPDPAGAFTIGRDADLTVDADNTFLHRRFLTLTSANGLWWLTNVGTQLTATVSDAAGAMQAWLAPGASMPLVFEHTVVWFTAGPTTYELDLYLAESLFAPVQSGPVEDGTRTLGRISLTPAQKLIIVALCEQALRRGNRGASDIPTSAAAAQRIGWPLTRFNRKLDNVCDRLTAMGVRGLHGGPERLASTRKARLVEYALAARVVVAADLALLDAGEDTPPTDFPETHRGDKLAIALFTKEKSHD